MSTQGNPGGPFAGLLFIVGVGAVLLVISQNEIGASVSQGILLIALLLILIALLNGYSGAEIITGKQANQPIRDKAGNPQ